MTLPPFAFTPSPLDRPASAGLWFAYRRRELLLSEDFRIRPVTSVAEWGLEPLRVQYLGELKGEPCFAAELSADALPPPQMQFVNQRALYGQVPDELIAIAGRALQVLEWDRTHQFCGQCGAPTQRHGQQRARVCADCKLEFYPRLAPAMIVAVERGREILLARSPHFPPGIYSVLAGFVDPGESVEDAVHREVFEETGIRVHNVRYFGSQPWPFPNSLMLGFQADYLSGEVVPDPAEIEAAGFFDAAALPATFPGNISISQWLLADFLRRNGA